MEQADPTDPWDYVQTTPGAGDDVIFAASYQTQGGHVCQFNSDCIVTSPVTVHKITIGYGYSAELTVKKPLTLSGSDGDSRLHLQSAATISGLGANPAGDGKIVLAGNSGLNWHTGTLKYLTVDVQRTGSTAAFMRVALAGGGLPSPSMMATTINVSGNLEWMAQDVQNQLGSTIQINSGGMFDITVAGKTWGSPGSHGGFPNTLTIQNDGKVTLNTPGTSTLIANYTTSGTTELQNGTLFIDGTAKQIGGQPAGSWFKLFTGTTVALGGTGIVLDIRAGAIVGNGTIQGNLTIGDPASQIQSGTAIISPGVDQQHSGGQVIGTLTVTGNFQMFNGEMHIEFDKVSETVLPQSELEERSGRVSVTQPEVCHA